VPETCGNRRGREKVSRGIILPGVEILLDTNDPRSPKPDFFIVGAARCGTTALFDYLAAHPGVFLPERKEPTYFCTDLRTYGEVATLTEYEALFSPAPPHALTGEASVLSCIRRSRSVK